MGGVWLSTRIYHGVGLVAFLARSLGSTLWVVHGFSFPGLQARMHLFLCRRNCPVNRQAYSSPA